MEVSVPSYREREIVFAVADATGLPDDVVWDHLRSYVAARVQDVLYDLRHCPQEQAHFARYAGHVERCQKRQTAPVGEAV